MTHKKSAIAVTAFMVENLEDGGTGLRSNRRRLEAMVVGSLWMLVLSACSRSPNGDQSADNGSVESRIKPDGQVSMAVVTPAPLPPVAPAAAPATPVPQ